MLIRSSDPDDKYTVKPRYRSSLPVYFLYNPESGLHNLFRS